MYKISDLSKKLKLLREYRNIKSQRKAAIVLGKHHQQWYLWESGQAYPAAAQIIEICNTFKVSLEYFYKDGLPEHFDFSGGGIDEQPIAFANTTVNKELLKIIKEAKRGCYLTFVKVYPGAGTSRIIREYASFEEHVLVYNGKKEIENLPRSGLKLVILDQAEHMPEEEVATFIRSVRKLTDGAVVICQEELKSIRFDKLYKLTYLSVDDLKRIVDHALPELKKILEANDYSDLMNQILSIFASEVIDDINKVLRLRELFLEEMIPNFSLENMLIQLYNI